MIVRSANHVYEEQPIVHSHELVDLAEWFKVGNWLRTILMTHIVVLRSFNASMPGGSTLKKSNVRQVAPESQSSSRYRRVAMLVTWDKVFSTSTTTAES